MFIRHILVTLCDPSFLAVNTRFGAGIAIQGWLVRSELLFDRCDSPVFRES